MTRERAVSLTRFDFMNCFTGTKACVNSFNQEDWETQIERVVGEA